MGRVRPDLEALRALELVAHSGSMSSAGARLGVSQQAVSLRVRELEKALGVRLLVRSARGSQLTPSGELVVGWGAPLLAAADEFAESVDTLRAERGRSVRVAASLTIAEHLLPEAVARWRSRVGDAGPIIQVKAANSSVVIDAVRAGEADLGFIETPAIPSDLESATVARDCIEVIVPHGHPWARTGRVSIHELARTPLVLREEGSGTRRSLEEALAAAGAPLTAAPAAVLSTTLAVRSAIMTGVAPGALSSLAVAEDIRTGRLIPVRIRNHRISRPLTAVWAGRSPSRAARDFLDTWPGATT